MAPDRVIRRHLFDLVKGQQRTAKAKGEMRGSFAALRMTATARTAAKAKAGTTANSKNNSTSYAVDIG
jgi:hypothetical protein